MKIEPNMIKGLKCIASQDCEGDCYKDHENFKHIMDKDDDWKPMVCGNYERDFVSGKPAQCCPYYQNNMALVTKMGSYGGLRI